MSKLGGKLMLQKLNILERINESGAYIIIHDFMMQDLHLAGVELQVYAVIFGYSRLGMGGFWGSLDFLAKRLDVSKRAIFEAIKKLIAKGFIVKGQRHFETNTYEYTIVEDIYLQEDNNTNSKTTSGEKSSLVEETSLGEKSSLVEESSTRLVKKIPQGVEETSTTSLKFLHPILNNNKYILNKNKHIDISSSQLQKQKNITAEDGDPLKPLSPSVAETMRKFIEYRKAIKKPMTSYAVKLMVKKLLGNEFKNDLERIKQLETSIINNWQDVFPVNRPQETETNNKQDKAQPSEKNWGWIPQRFVLRAEQLVTSRRWVGALAYLDGMRLVTPPDEREQALIKIEQELQCHEKWEVIA